MNTNWKKIAEEYKKEIHNLHNDMLEASRSIEEASMPKDIKRACAILNNSIESSEKAIHEVKLMEND